MKKKNPKCSFSVVLLRQLSTVQHTHQQLLVQLCYLTMLYTVSTNKTVDHIPTPCVKIKSAAPPVAVQELPSAFYLPPHYAGFDSELNVS